MSMCLQNNGRIKRLDEVMSVHRNHQGGIYSKLSYLDKQVFSFEARIYFRSKLPALYEPAFKKGLKAILQEITWHIDDLNRKNEELLKKNAELTKEINKPLINSENDKNMSEIQEILRYKSYKDLSLTVKNNILKIPRDIDLVVGIPRSGMIPATMIGQILNKPVVALDSYLDGKLYEMGHYRRPKNMLNDFSNIKKVLIVDDSINTGGSLIKVKEKVAGSDKNNIETLYCAIYFVQDSLKYLDIGFEECVWPRIFQWNILNSWILERACVDIDGVICTDPTEDENDDGENYKRFLLNAKPLHLTDFTISCFVTSRLEKYREKTEAWFKKHSINYKDLIMLDLPSKEERLKRNCHASFKAEVYKNRNEELFIESSLSQAHEIADLTGKLVFCTENMEMIFPTVKRNGEMRKNELNKIKNLDSNIIPQ